MGAVHRHDQAFGAVLARIVEQLPRRLAHRQWLDIGPGEGASLVEHRLEGGIDAEALGPQIDIAQLGVAHAEQHLGIDRLSRLGHQHIGGALETKAGDEPGEARFQVRQIGQAARFTQETQRVGITFVHRHSRRLRAGARPPCADVITGLSYNYSVVRARRPTLNGSGSRAAHAEGDRAVSPRYNDAGAAGMM